MNDTVAIGDIVSLTDIARLIGVRPSAVTNWRKRFPESFPRPFTRVANGRTPLFRKSEVFVWYRDRYREQEMDPELVAFLQQPLGAKP